MKVKNEGGRRVKGELKKNGGKSILVSVVTVVFNGESYLEQTIQSVLNQTYENIEYIIVDGGSTDGTLDIVKKYDDQIDYWISEPDKGIYDAMNKGLSLVNGELIGIINADDWYQPDTIATVIEYTNKEPAAGVYYGMLRIWKDEELYFIQGNTVRQLEKTMIAHPTCFVKKNCYLNYGMFDTLYPIAGDYELMFRFLKNDVQFVFIEKILTNFRTGGVCNTVYKKREFEKLKLLRSYRRIGPVYFLYKKISVTITQFLLFFIKNNNI
jgi:glycosyltransferase involved in cell wall biosynthesis